MVWIVINIICDIMYERIKYRNFELNYLIIVSICNFILGTDNRQTKILISIVVVFILCQSMTIVADIYEAVSCSHLYMNGKICISNDYIENIIDVAHFALSLNSSINFLFYVAYDPNFRNSFLKVNITHWIFVIYLDWSESTFNGTIILIPS